MELPGGRQAGFHPRICEPASVPGPVRYRDSRRISPERHLAGTAVVAGASDSLFLTAGDGAGRPDFQSPDVSVRGAGIAADRVEPAADDPAGNRAGALTAAVAAGCPVGAQFGGFVDVDRCPGHHRVRAV